MLHIPVLLSEVLNALDLPHRRLIIDATLGLGGHSESILSTPEFTGTVIGIDRDRSHLREAQKRLQRFDDRFTEVNMNFQDLPHYLDQEKISFDGILFDLGIASPHVERAERGFSFHLEGPLDMRMDQDQKLTAADIINQASEEELSRIFHDFGEEPLARSLARTLLRSRPLKTTTELADLVLRVYRTRGYRDSRRHPAVRVFQALRIAVNDELVALDKALKAVIDRIQPQGRMVVISYHSLEDRLVKQLFRQAAHPCICPPKSPICTCGKKPMIRILTKRPIVPTAEEIYRNPRARSAKMRVAEKSIDH